MTRVSDEEKRRVFSEYNRPTRLIYQIVRARKRNESEDYDSEKFLATSKDTIDQHMDVAEGVFKLFAKSSSND